MSLTIFDHFKDEQNSNTLMQPLSESFKYKRYLHNSYINLSSWSVYLNARHVCQIIYNLSEPINLKIYNKIFLRGPNQLGYKKNTFTLCLTDMNQKSQIINSQLVNAAYTWFFNEFEQVDLEHINSLVLTIAHYGTINITLKFTNIILHQS